MEWLNYYRLRDFWTVAKEGILARTAASLHVAQPSISEQLQGLENALGEKLFRRDGRKHMHTDNDLVVFGFADRIAHEPESVSSSATPLAWRSGPFTPPWNCLHPCQQTADLPMLESAN